MIFLTPHQIETATAIGWPAQDETNISGWRVFSGLGPVGRINSCGPLTFTGTDVEAAIDQVEAHYRVKALAPQFKLIVDGTAPADLYKRLIARGYQTASHVAVMTSSQPLPPPAYDVAITASVTESFASVVSETSPTALDGQERVDILNRVPNPSAFGSIAIEGELVAVGLATFTGTVLASLRCALNRSIVNEATRALFCAPLQTRHEHREPLLFGYKLRPTMARL
jgi:N-acetylglutamate synthase